MSLREREILCDAQTSGGLLVVVDKSGVEAFNEIAERHGLELEPIGETHEAGEHTIEVV